MGGCTPCSWSKSGEVDMCPSRQQHVWTILIRVALSTGREAAGAHGMSEPPPGVRDTLADECRILLARVYGRRRGPSNRFRFGGFTTPLRCHGLARTASDAQLSKRWPSQPPLLPSRPTDVSCLVGATSLQIGFATLDFLESKLPSLSV
jgi:hypothetical protein